MSGGHWLDCLILLDQEVNFDCRKANERFRYCGGCLYHDVRLYVISFLGADDADDKLLCTTLLLDWILLARRYTRSRRFKK